MFCFIKPNNPAMIDIDPQTFIKLYYNDYSWNGLKIKWLIQHYGTHSKGWILYVKLLMLVKWSLYTTRVIRVKEWQEYTHAIRALKRLIAEQIHASISTAITMDVWRYDKLPSLQITVSGVLLRPRADRNNQFYVFKAMKIVFCWTQHLLG